MDIKDLTIPKIGAILGENPTDVQLKAMKQDSRSGVKKLLTRYYRLIELQRIAKEKADRMLLEERRLWEQGILYIGGIDEAGRGPLAGPVCAACVILPKGLIMDGVDDSKKLSPAKRDEMYDSILENAVSYGIALVGHERIDEINIYQATIEAMNQAVAECSIVPEYLLIDAMALRENPIPQLSLISGDSRSQSIAAASILAKVTRDRVMERLDKEYPGYGFEKHKGYGTEEHIKAIYTLGLSPVHRRSFQIR